MRLRGKLSDRPARGMSPARTLLPRQGRPIFASLFVEKFTTATSCSPQDWHEQERASRAFINMAVLTLFVLPNHKTSMVFLGKSM